MRILVTGATGFLGSHLVKGLIRDNHQVIILKRSSSDTSRIQKHLNMITSYDIDKYPISNVFSNENIDVVVHTATSYGNNQPMSEMIESNVLFPIKLIENAVKKQVQAFINTDTFFNKEGNQLYSYLNSYSTTKRHFLELARYYCESKNIKFINTRLEHVYGPYDNLSKFTHNTITQLLNHAPVLKLTPGEQRRDFIFVDDVVSAYCRIIENSMYSSDYYSEYEIGNGSSLPIKQFIETVHSLTKSSTELQFGAIPYRDLEIMESYADTSKLKELGWMGKIDLKEGIKQIVESLV